MREGQEERGGEVQGRSGIITFPLPLPSFPSFLDSGTHSDPIPPPTSPYIHPLHPSPTRPLPPYRHPQHYPHPPHLLPILIQYHRPHRSPSLLHSPLRLYRAVSLMHLIRRNGNGLITTGSHFADVITAHHGRIAFQHHFH